MLNGIGIGESDAIRSVPYVVKRRRMSLKRRWVQPAHQHKINNNKKKINEKSQNFNPPQKKPQKTCTCYILYHDSAVLGIARFCDSWILVHLVNL